MIALTAERVRDYRFVRAMMVTLARAGMQERPTGASVRSLRLLAGSRFDTCEAHHVLRQLPARPTGRAYRQPDGGPKYVHGPTTARGVVLPLFTVDFAFEPAPGQISVQVVLCVLYDERLRLSGFRFESPNPDGQEHNYFHAQPTRVVRGDPEDEMDTPVWLSDRTPTFPLDASSWAELTLATLTSLYARERTSELVQMMRQYGAR